MAEVDGRSQVAKPLTWGFATGTRRVCGGVRWSKRDLRVDYPTIIGRCRDGGLVRPGPGVSLRRGI